MFTNEIELRRFQEKYAEAVSNNNFTKVSAELSPYIKVSIYEQSVVSAFLRDRPVSASDLIPEVGHNDTFYVMGQVEQPTKEAVAVNFRGQAATFTPGGRRFKIPLGRHMSKVSRKPQDELMAFNYDLFQELEEKDVFELHTLRDRKFLNACHASVVTSGKSKEYLLSGSATVVRPDKIHFTENSQLLEAGARTGYPSENVLKATKHLFAQQLWHDLNLWESEGAGGDLVSQISINGYPATMLMGIAYVTSVKNVLYVEKDPSAYITFTDLGVNAETVVIDGVTYTFKTSPAGVTGDREVALGATAAEAATALYTVLVRDQGEDDCLGNNWVFTNPSAGVVKVRKVYDADWKRYSPDPFVVSETCTNASWGTVGADLFDHIYTFPDAEYLGEIVRINGKEIESDIWKERGEKTTEVCRRSSEFSGGAIGNINGAALARLQRSEY